MHVNAFLLRTAIRLYRLIAISKDAQSTEKSVLYGFLSLVSVYRKNIYARIYGFFLTRFGYYPRPHCTFETRGILRTKKLFMDECTDFYLLVSATSPPPPPPPPTRPIALSRYAVFRARRVNFFGYYSPGPVCFRTSQDFSEFRWGNPESVFNRATSDYNDNNPHSVATYQCHARI